LQKKKNVEVSRYISYTYSPPGALVALAVGEVGTLPPNPSISFFKDSNAGVFRRLGLAAMASVRVFIFATSSSFNGNIFLAFFY